MKIGVTIEPFKGIAAGQLVSFAKTIMLDHIEINERIYLDVEGVINSLGKMTTVFHLPIWGVERYDLGSKGKGNEKKIRKVIEFLNEHKEELNMIYTLSHPPEAPDSTSERLIDRLEQIEMPLVLENIPRQPDDEFMEFYLNAKDRLGKKVAGHAIDGPHRYLTDWENWLNVPKELLKEIVYVHVSDCNKKEDLHRPLGRGILPFNDFFAFLKKIGYRGVINQELKVEGLDQLEAIMDSCLYCIKPFSKSRYAKMKLKYSFLKPILRRKVKKAAKAVAK